MMNPTYTTIPLNLIHQQFKMSYRYYLAFLLALCLSHPPNSVLVAQNLPYKAVNLGNWLLAEGWMEPSLFDGIPVNKDLLV